MIKFLLGFVTLMVVLLAAYMFTDKPNETPKTTMTKVEKRDVSEKRVEVSETKEVKTSKKVVSVAKPLKDLKRKVSKVSHAKAAIGEGLTLESIENADVSDEEKERLINDMVYHESLKEIELENLSEDEIENMIIKDLERIKEKQ